MGIIKKLQLFYKAWKGNLSIDELSGLCAQCEDKLDKGLLSAQECLKMCFRRNLTEAEAETVAKSSWAVQNLYLQTVRDCELSEAEQAMLVRQMPWDMTKQFPAPLNDELAAELFAGKDARKIVAYCRQFVLPEKLELELIDNYRRSLTDESFAMPYGFLEKKLNGWKEALHRYLTANFSQGRMAGEASQQALLALNEAAMTVALMKCADILHNPLSEKTLTALIEGKNEEAIRVLLRESYLPTKVSPALTKCLPQLKYQDNIATLRHALAKVENELGRFLGAESPSANEFTAVQEYITHVGTEEQKAEFLEVWLLPMLYGEISPYMCAWVAYYYPEKAQQAYKVLREYAKSCAKKYKKRV